MAANLSVAQPTSPENAPLSAIDWLDNVAPAPVALPDQPSEPPVAETGLGPAVTSQPLGTVSAAGAGLLPASVTGLPTDLWAASRDNDLAAQLSALPDILLPAQQELRYRLLLAEAQAPQQTAETPHFLRARVTALLDLGAVEQANALLLEAGADTPTLFDLWFDAALLTGTEEAPCQALAIRPALSDALGPRVFCLARTGNWDAAALTLQTGRALGDLTPTQTTLLTWFLDPELAEGADPLPVSGPMTPLEFRLREAVGTALPTSNQPRAYAAADLRSTAGWKAQLEAAERLAQTAALPANQLLGIYTARQPSASGGVWDRVEAIQRLETALTTRDPTAISTLLPPAWEGAKSAGIETVMAQILAPRITDLPLGPKAKTAADQILILSDSYEKASDTAGIDPFWAGVAAGDVRGLTPGTDLETAISAGFADGADLPTTAADLLQSGKLGAAILLAMHLAADAQDGSLSSVAPALALMRHIGLEDIARRTALNLLLVQDAG